MSATSAINAAGRIAVERQSFHGAQVGGPSFVDALDAEADRGSRDDKARLAAEKLVSSALLEPALASMRDSPFLEGPFAPGPAEKRFGPLLDAVIAERVTSASSFYLVDAIVARYPGLAAEVHPGSAPAASIQSAEAQYGDF